MKTSFLIAVALAFAGATAQAHDTWVETNTNVFRVGDCTQIDLKLGNHGNEHRDFKLASKVALDNVQLQVISPDGAHFDLKSNLVDTGYTPKEGYWTTMFTGSKPGLYTVSNLRRRNELRARTRHQKRKNLFPHFKEPRPGANGRARIREAMWQWPRVRARKRSRHSDGAGHPT